MENYNLAIVNLIECHAHFKKNQDECVEVYKTIIPEQVFLVFHSFDCTDIIDLIGVVPICDIATSIESDDVKVYGLNILADFILDAS